MSLPLTNLDYWMQQPLWPLEQCRLDLTLCADGPADVWRPGFSLVDLTTSSTLEVATLGAVDRRTILAQWPAIASAGIDSLLRYVGPF